MAQRFGPQNVSATRGNDSRPCQPFQAKGLFKGLKAVADTGFLVAFANRKGY